MRQHRSWHKQPDGDVERKHNREAVKLIPKIRALCVADMLVVELMLSLETTTAPATIAVVVAAAIPFRGVAARIENNFHDKNTPRDNK